MADRGIGWVGESAPALSFFCLQKGIKLSASSCLVRRKQTNRRSEKNLAAKAADKAEAPQPSGDDSLANSGVGPRLVPRLRILFCHDMENSLILNPWKCSTIAGHKCLTAAILAQPIIPFLLCWHASHLNHCPTIARWQFLVGLRSGDAVLCSTLRLAQASV